MRPVVISGVGAHCGFGDVAETGSALAAGRSAIEMKRFAFAPGELPAAMVADASPVEFLRDRKMVKYMSPAASLGVVAAGRALRHAGLLNDEPRCASLGLFVSTGLIAFDVSAVSPAIEACRAADGSTDLRRLGGEGLRACPPLLPFKMLLNMSLGLVSIVFGIRGHNFISYPGADQGGGCLEAAIRGIGKGRFERALVGGTSQGLSFMPLCTMKRLGRLASSVEAAQPYSNSHAGMAPTDGAAFVVLESMEAAIERGQEPLAVVHPPALAWHSGEQEREETLRLTWEAASEVSTPEQIVTTGNVTQQHDALDLALARGCFGLAAPVVRSFDGGIGWLGAAALPMAVALASKHIAARRGSVLVSGSDSGGGIAAVCLTSPRGAA